MRTRARGRIRALTLAAALVGWAFTAGLDQPWRRHPALHAALVTGLAVLARARFGLRTPAATAGLRLGAAVGAAAAAGIASSTALPRVRTGMADVTCRLPRPLAGCRNSLGTVWSEEVAFRGALSTVAAAAFGPTGGRALQSVTFGLSHLPDARDTGEPIVGTVLVTSVAGWMFALLAERSGSLLAPMMAHLAINESGAVAALAVQRYSRTRR